MTGCLCLNTAKASRRTREPRAETRTTAGLRERHKTHSGNNDNTQLRNSMDRLWVCYEQQHSFKVQNDLNKVAVSS